jgi:glutamyl-Q tRNA(Asp) synthetase
MTVEFAAMPPPVFRFAPSPNGYLHLGHAYSALLNADQARAKGGRLLLRIEDIDETRCRPEYEAAIYEDLRWLGVTWDGPVRRQSEHYEDYRAALAKLEALGLIYPSFESRAEIARMAAGVDPDGAPLYSGAGKALPAAERRRRIEAGAPYALRLDMDAALQHILSFRGARGASEPGIQERDSVPPLDSGSRPSGGPGMTWNENGRDIVANPAASPELWGEVVLARKETPTSYHLSVVVDDAAQGVTDVVRGQDLYHATAVHRVLQTLLGLPSPRYRHHRLILDDTGRKLSKSTQATGLRELRAAGATPADIRQRVGLA